MKKNLLWGLMALVISALCFASCDDDDDDTDEYYVRYTVSANPGDDFFVSYLDEHGKEHIVQGTENSGKVETIVGPVRQGFRASLAASVNGGQAPEYLQIDVSCDGNPFVRKVYLHNGLSTEYVITKEDR